MTDIRGKWLLLLLPQGPANQTIEFYDPIVGRLLLLVFVAVAQATIEKCNP